MKIEVIKIGGNVIDDEAALDEFLQAFAKKTGWKVLVHGGGKLATRLASQLGIETQMIDGRRVTDDQTIDLVTMVYGGLTNKQLVARLNALGCPAIGLSGADGNVMQSVLRKKEPIDYGWVGDPDTSLVNVSLLMSLLEQGLTPVFCALTHDGQGHLLNTNADTIASTAAVALATKAEVTLTYCFEQPGVLRDVNDPASVIPVITPDLFEQLKADGTVSKGMLPKLHNAFEALKKGVKEVRISKTKISYSGSGHAAIPKSPLQLLERMIATPSLSRQEDATAGIIYDYLAANGIAEVQRYKNNVWARTARWDDSKPTLLLNSHHDTVKPWTGGHYDPFTPTHADGRIYGRGSNDAGASVVSLVTTFIQLYREPLPVNLLLAITAEEEVTGANGIRALLPELPKIDMAIVGEPTQMQGAIAERGLMVIDGTAHGKAGHAARNEGVNALYKALDDIDRLRSFRPEKVSQVLGPIKVSVTQIDAGTQHNVVPDECHFVCDVRTTDAYTNEETLALLQGLVGSDLKARSTHIRASVLAADHPLAIAAKACGRELFVSPTTSDMSQMPFPSLKMGPGDSARSHTTDEFIYEKEIEEAIPLYVQLIKNL